MSRFLSYRAIAASLALATVLVSSSASAALCAKCAGNNFIMNLGTCVECKADTVSGSFKLCPVCSAKLNQCEACRAAVVCVPAAKATVVAPAPVIKTVEAAAVVPATDTKPTDPAVAAPAADTKPVEPVAVVPAADTKPVEPAAAVPAVEVKPAGQPAVAAPRAPARTRGTGGSKAPAGK